MTSLCFRFLVDTSNDQNLKLAALLSCSQKPQRQHINGLLLIRLHQNSSSKSLCPDSFPAKIKGNQRTSFLPHSPRVCLLLIVLSGTVFFFCFLSGQKTQMDAESAVCQAAASACMKSNCDLGRDSIVVTLTRTEDFR